MDGAIAIGEMSRKLGELLTEEHCRLPRSTRGRVDSLRGELESMRAWFAQASEDQDDDVVQNMAAKLRDLSYQVEDAMDSFMVKVQAGGDNHPKHDMKKLLNKSISLVTKIKSIRQIDDAVEQAGGLLKEIMSRLKREHGGGGLSSSSSSTDNVRVDVSTDAAADERDLVGLDHARDEMIKKLSHDGDDDAIAAAAGSQHQLKTLSIVGHAGLGKTTLAKQVYHKIKARFDCSAFVSLSQKPDMNGIFKDMLRQLDAGFSTDLMDGEIQPLIHELESLLREKRFLVVIDDIWNENAWSTVKSVFPSTGRFASQVITTTRIHSVAQACCSSSNDVIYPMQPLNDDQSRILFHRRIFSGDGACPPEFDQLSRDILKKCGGIPLFIITVARVLASDGKEVQAKARWQSLLKSVGRGGFTGDDRVGHMKKILLFSYYDLPSHLKTCFLYLSIFPEDYEIKRDELIWRWISEGFVQGEKTETSLFERGETYFNELLNRSMIQPVHDGIGGIRACRVHNMMLGVIRSLSDKESFVTILDGGDKAEQTADSQNIIVRRLSLLSRKEDDQTTTAADSQRSFDRRPSLQNRKEDDHQNTPLASMSKSQLRSVTIFPPAIDLMIPLRNFLVLRVLDLSGCSLGESSSSSSSVHFKLTGIEKLVCLRYLGLAGTGIRELPAQIGKLELLQVLDTRNNPELKEMSILKLRRLVCLHIDGYQTMRLLPQDDAWGLRNLASLQVLEDIRASPSIVEELRYLLKLRVLKINLRDVSSAELEEVFVEHLCNLHSIQSLVLGGDSSFGSMDLLGERWVPPRRLAIFESHMLGSFSRLPSWIKRNLSLLQDLCELSISLKQVEQEDLEILARLPALRRLQVDSARQTGERLRIGSAGFKRVMAFTLFCQSSAHVLFDGGALPRAERLEFDLGVRVAKRDGNGGLDLGLQKDPHQLPSLQKVFVRIFVDGGAAAEEAEAAAKAALQAHPNKPKIMIDIVTTPITAAGMKDDDEATSSTQPMISRDE